MYKKDFRLRFGAYLLISILLTLGLSISFQGLLAAANWTVPTANPPSQNVYSPIYATSSIHQVIDRVGATGGGLVVNYGISTPLNVAASGWFSGDGQNEGVKVDVNGNVGIGDATPAALLSVGNGDLFQINLSGYALAPVGAVATPAYSFVSDPNTGIYHGAAVDTLNFTTAGVDRLSIIASGNVGIGNYTNPTNTLDVNGALGVRNGQQLRLYEPAAGPDYLGLSVPNLPAGYSLTLPSSAGANGQVLTTNGPGGVLSWTTSSTINSGTAGQVAYYNAAGTNFSGSTNFTFSGSNLIVSGSVTASSFIYSSDRSLKENIHPIDNALEKILSLDGVSFNWKENGDADLGVVAQDVEDVFPELVKTNPETGLKSVEYGNLVAPLIEAIKEQQKQIEELKKEVESLKK